MLTIDSVKVTPGAPPMTLSKFSNALRVDNSDDNDLLRTLMGSAVEEVEQYTQKALVRQGRKLSMRWPTQHIELPFGPVQRITSIQYYDTDDVLRTIDPSQYVLQDGVVTPTASPGVWPDNIGGVRDKKFFVSYESGYVDDSVDPPVGAVPDNLLTAVILLGQAMYDRNPQTDQSLRKAAERLMDSAREGQGV